MHDTYVIFTECLLFRIHSNFKKETGALDYSSAPGSSAKPCALD